MLNSFADDTSLFSIVTNPTLFALELNSDLKVIENWGYQWKMLFNPDPTKQAIGMLFSRKKVDQNHPPVLFNNAPVGSASDYKHLRIILDRKLLFTKHIREKVAKARKGISIIRHLSSIRTLLTNYTNCSSGRILTIVISYIRFCHNESI